MYVVLAAASDEDDGARFAEDEGGARVVAELS